LKHYVNGDDSDFCDTALRIVIGIFDCKGAGIPKHVKEVFPIDELEQFWLTHDRQSGALAERLITEMALDVWNLRNPSALVAHLHQIVFNELEALRMTPFEFSFFLFFWHCSLHFLRLSSSSAFVSGFVWVVI
jgi:hypothetical protein